MASSPSRFERTRCLRRGWVFERVGWIAMAAVLLAAVAGLFGNGWLSEREASAGALSVKYPRFGRALAPLDLAVDWLPGREATLWISRPYLDDFEIAEVRPTPAAVTVGSDRIYYTFRTAAPHARVGVTFTLRPKRSGRFSGRLGSDTGLDLEIRQLVFP